MFPAIGSTITAAIPRACARHNRFTESMSLYWAISVSAAVARVTPGLVGIPSVVAPRAGLYQERVSVAVIAPGKLDYLIAAGSRPRDTNRAHRGLGARIDESHAFDRRHETTDLLPKFDFDGCGCAEARSGPGRLGQGTGQLRGCVSVDQRTP